jgi:hypothetical protein
MLQKTDETNGKIVISRKFENNCHIPHVTVCIAAHPV